MPEILPDFLSFTTEGLYCPYGDFYIDPTAPVSQAVISHAHGDHARPDHAHVYATPATVSFMEHRFGKRAYRKAFIMPYQELFQIGAVQFTFIPAGHILGSAQVLMEYKGVRYLYTGDYKLQEDPTCMPFQVIEADVLITESTFANPDVQHPNPITEISKLKKVESNILLGAYALGKAQRLTYLINRYCPEKTIWLHHTMLPLHRIYEQYTGLTLNYQPYNRKALKLNPSNQIYMVPPMTFRQYIRATNVVRVFASGWSRLQVHNELSLYISDHVDWGSILDVIEQVRAKEVWTLHGDGRALKNHFQHTPIQVKHLN